MEAVDNIKKQYTIEWKWNDGKNANKNKRWKMAIEKPCQILIE